MREKNNKNRALNDKFKKLKKKTNKIGIMLLTMFLNC